MEETARRGALKGRWEALPEPEKAEIQAEFDRDNLPIPGVHPRFREVARKQGCIDLLSRRQPS